MTDVTFTGERLHEGSGLFGVDLARHRAAYEFARQRLEGLRILEFGSGSGYGAAELAEAGCSIVGIDRVPPDRAQRTRGARFLRGDLRAVPILPEAFDAVVSFQVIEHLEDPQPYLEAIARSLAPGGVALITTPNRLTSDGVNPFHVHEYEPGELEKLLAPHFDEIEMLGVSAGPAVAEYFAARLARIRRIMRLDPLGLRDRLPRGLIEWLFGRLALVVRSGIQSDGGLPEASWRDFPIGPVDAECLDLLAVCRRAP